MKQTGPAMPAAEQDEVQRTDRSGNIGDVGGKADRIRRRAAAEFDQLGSVAAGVMT